jgi:putative transposase
VTFGNRDLTESGHAWPDSIHLAEARSWGLVGVCVRADGKKELIVMAEGYRDSAESWADVFPEMRPRWCWVHKTAKALNVARFERGCLVERADAVTA